MKNSPMLPRTRHLKFLRWGKTPWLQSRSCSRKPGDLPFFNSCCQIDLWLTNVLSFRATPDLEFVHLCADSRHHGLGRSDRSDQSDFRSCCCSVMSRGWRVWLDERGSLLIGRINVEIPFKDCMMHKNVWPKGTYAMWSTLFARGIASSLPDSASSMYLLRKRNFGS